MGRDGYSHVVSTNLRFAMRLLLIAIFFLSACAPQPPNTAAGIIPEGPPPPYVAWITVSGKSMMPTFPDSFLAEVDITFPYEGLKVGDLVLFWNYKRTGAPFYTFHRIVEAKNGYFVVRGDNPETNPVPDEALLGKHNFIGKGTGRHCRFLVAPINASP